MTNRLAVVLRKHGRRAARVRRMTFTTLPLVNDIEFEGTPVRLLMSPGLPPLNGAEAEAVFDAWLWPWVSQDAARETDVIGLTNRAVFQFASAGETEGESALRLIYALSALPGAELECDNVSAMIHADGTTFGLTNGVAHSRFCEGVTLDFVSPQHYFEQTRSVRTFDPHFHSLYREAYRHGKGAVEALIAIHMGNPGFSFKRLSKLALQTNPPTKYQIQRWERVILEHRDPLSALFTELVPERMNKSTFFQTFGQLCKRTLNPDVIQRQNYLTRMHDTFYRLHRPD